MDIKTSQLHCDPWLCFQKLLGLNKIIWFVMSFRGNEENGVLENEVCLLIEKRLWLFLSNLNQIIMTVVSSNWKEELFSGNNDFII